MKRLTLKELEVINSLVDELNAVRDLIFKGAEKQMVYGLPTSIRDDCARILNTRLLNREQELISQLKNQYHVEV